jgi:hypothetical protein
MGRHSYRALLSISAAVVTSCVVGCSGDDTSSSPDGSAPDGSVAVDAAADGTAKDAGMADSTGEGGVGSAADGSAVDGSIVDGAGNDAGATDASTDSAASSDGAMADGATTDASDAAPLPPQPLALCAAFDSRFLLNEADAGTANAEADRTRTWAYDIYDNFFNGTGPYIGGDCSFSGFTLAVTSTSDTGNAYNAFLDSWIQQFLGCPIAGDAGTLAYGLLPSELAGHVYTTADLNKLSSDFVDGIINTLTCAGDCLNGAYTLPDGGTLANVAPLTDQQVASIRAELAYLQSQVSTTTLDSGTISFSTDPSCDPSTECMDLCPAPDAGAQDASGD